MPRPATGPALQIERLSVSFDTPRGEVQALREVSLEVEAGEVFGIAGESGSGKSTLAYAIMGDLAPNARVLGGTVRFAGDDLLRLAPGALRRIRRGRQRCVLSADDRAAREAAGRSPRERIAPEPHELFALTVILPPAFPNLIFMDMVPCPEFRCAPDGIVHV